MIRVLEHLGVPRVLMLGFLAVAIFMTGDGFELTFLSKFMVDQGFTSSQASLLVTVYGLFAAFGGWSAGVLAEMFGANALMMIIAAIIVGIGTCAFSSLPTIMTLYAGEGKQGAALSAYNLAAGLTTFAGPGVATILLPTIGYGGVCWTYAALYVLAFILTLFIRPQQPGFDSHGHRIKKSADSVKEVAAEAKEDAPAVA